MGAALSIRLPDDSQRLVIVGKTGTGKTQCAIWHLARRSWDTMPWIIIDYKRDSLIAKLPAKEISLARAPSAPGLYVVRPMPTQDDAALEAFLWQVWHNENTGLFVDEGFMIPQHSDAFQAILTQGRSKHIPTITLSQRPVWLSRFVFSEADFFQCFWLNDRDDRKSLERFLPFTIERLPNFHSSYYDVSLDKATEWKPVPRANAIVEMFRARSDAPRLRTI